MLFSFATRPSAESVHMKRQPVQLHRSPSRLTLPLLVTVALGLAACHGDSDAPSTQAPPPVATASRINVELARTTYGVPHVRANDFRSLGYGLAYAYAQDNLCMFADSMVTVRGE